MSHLRALGGLSLTLLGLASSGCTSAGLALNALSDLGQDAQLRALDQRAAAAEAERDALRARLADLQRRVEGLERGEALRAATQPTQQVLPAAVTQLPLPPRSRVISPDL